MESTNTVYLIHFDRPYIAKTGQMKKQAQHYLGWTPNLPARMKAHAAGQGARLMEVITEDGIGWRVVRTWNGDRKLERKLKSRHKPADFCPCCNQRIAHLLIEAQA